MLALNPDAYTPSHPDHPDHPDTCYLYNGQTDDEGWAILTRTVNGHGREVRIAELILIFRFKRPLLKGERPFLRCGDKLCIRDEHVGRRIDMRGRPRKL